MLTNKINTIEEHQAIIGSRFQLAQLVMKRTKQFYNGAAPCKGLPKELGRNVFRKLPKHSWPKVALEELRLGKLKWERLSTAIEPAAKPVIEENPIVFGE
jgi:DNA-directed RNA polymerase subunit K/omega